MMWAAGPTSRLPVRAAMIVPATLAIAVNVVF